MESATGVHQSGHSWREVLMAAQQDYEHTKRERRRLARSAAMAGLTKRQIAEAMGISVNMAQKLTGLTGKSGVDLDETMSWSGGSADVTATLNNCSR